MEKNFKPVFPGHYEGMPAEEFRIGLQKFNDEYLALPIEERKKIAIKNKFDAFNMWMECVKIAADHCGVDPKTYIRIGREFIIDKEEIRRWADYCDFVDYLLEGKEMNVRIGSYN